MPSKQEPPSDSDQSAALDVPALLPVPVEEAPTRFPIVAIGASAGGLDALEQLVSRLGASGMAYLLLQHLSPDHPSKLAPLLAAHATLPVRLMEHEQAIEPNIIYVCPPGIDLEVVDGALHFHEQSPHRAGSLPIDRLFRSLARDQGATSIGVVLSGAGSDGAQGIRHLKEEGGMVFAQQPATATHDGMPRSALDTGCVDVCLGPAEIGDELTALGGRHSERRRSPGPQLDEDGLADLFEQLRRAFGVDFAAYKLSTVQRRLERRMALRKIAAFDDYLALVRENQAELRALYADLLISVTGFFRDRAPFEALKQTILPALLDGRDRQTPLRVWVPGCATGEEAYSLLICLLEYVEEHAPGQRIQVFATDIDEQALSRARQGLYPPSIERDVSAQRLQRFFLRVPRGYQVSRKLRDLVVFARHNLGKDPPFSRLDVVSCRNVLIYLQPALQKQLMRIFHYALNTRGYLLLGAAESVGEASDLFSLLDRKLKHYVKKHNGSFGVFDFSLGRRPRDGASAVKEPPAEGRTEPTIQQLIDRKILERYGPPGVLVDENLNILQFRGQTGPFLAPSPGAATLSVLRMVRAELLVPLKGALQRALLESVPMTCEATRMSDGMRSLVAMDVLPVEAVSQPRCLLVLFREQTAALEPDGTSKDAGTSESYGQRVQELERELVSTKDYLETLIQELATSNEELQSSNEEQQSANEELQSTNEELETSKEELQSTNEELVTVNEELHTRLVQLGVANDDLGNVLTNVSSSLVLVGLDLRIRRFSAAAERLLNLLPSDLGRPVSYLGVSLNVPQIESTVKECIDSMRAKDLHVRCSNGGWYTMRTVPYQTADRAIRGAVIELTSNPTPARPSGAMELNELASKVLSTLPHDVIVLDQSLCMVWANQSFLRAWGVGHDVLGLPLENLLPRDDSHATLWQKIEDAVFSGHSFDAFTLRQAWGAQGERVVSWSARSLADGSDGSPLGRPRARFAGPVTVLTIAAAPDADGDQPDELRAT